MIRKLTKNRKNPRFCHNCFADLSKWNVSDSTYLLCGQCMIRLGKSQPNYPEIPPLSDSKPRTVESKGKVRGKHLTPVEPRAVFED